MASTKGNRQDRDLVYGYEAGWDDARNRILSELNKHKDPATRALLFGLFESMDNKERDARLAEYITAVSGE